MIKAVLFDLDGTLLDTGYERAKALNMLREESGLAPMPMEELRPYLSYGGPRLVSVTFGVSAEGAKFEQLKNRYFEIYAANLGKDTKPFDGILDLLDELEARDIRWGVITNKPSYLTIPLLDKFGFTKRTCAVVSGDTSPYRKPDPRSILYACSLCEVKPEECLVLGDAERDIVAAQEAGAHILVCHFDDADSNQDSGPISGVDGLVRHPLEVIDWINGL